MKKFLFSTVLISAFYLLSAVNVNADTTCQPIYGGGQTCIQTGQVVVNKAVLNPKTNEFVDNLGVNDPKFSSDQMVNFKITVTNTGNTAISQVDIKDIFPQFINFAAGAGNFDQNSKIFSFSALNLNPSEQRTFVVTGKVVPNNQLPSDKGIVCVVNQVTAANGNQQSQDNAEFCIQKQVEQVTTKGGLKVFPPSTTTTTPSTGPEMLSLLALIPSGLMGLFLRKKSTSN